jgi:lipoprotein NlpI
MNRANKFLLLVAMLLSMATTAFCDAAVDDYQLSFFQYQIGDLDGAIADLTEAIELKPDFADAYYDRGIAKICKGDLDGAIADFTKALDLNPENVLAYHNRGCLRYDLLDFTNALADFKKVVEFDPSSDYAHFRIWLIRTRLGQAEASVELQSYLTGRTKGKPDDWASQVGRFLSGQLTEPDFLVAAKNANTQTQAGQRLCEAYFYAGSKHLFADDKETAADYFQKSVATGRKSCTEYQSALAELKLLKAEVSAPTMTNSFPAPDELVQVVEKPQTGSGNETVTNAPTIQSPTPMPASITPAQLSVASVFSVNKTWNFVILNISGGQPLPPGRILSIFRNGSKTAEVKVSGPQNGSYTAADILSGEARKGDEARGQ